MPSCSLGASPNWGQAQAAPIYLFVLAFPRRAMSEARQAGSADLFVSACPRRAMRMSEARQEGSQPTCAVCT